MSAPATPSAAPAAPLFHLPKERIEALVDGVFAIAMTILVLELKVPELAERRSAAELFGHLRHELPTIAAYFFSFFMLGIFWTWFHRLASKLVKIDLPMLAMQLCFLSLVSAFPFAAALLGRYVVNPASLAVYLPLIGSILAVQAGSFYLAEARGLLNPAMSAAEIITVKRRNLKSLMIFSLAAIPASLRLGVPGIAICLIAGAACGLALRRLRA